MTKDIRGLFASAGTFSEFTDDRNDGYNSVAWAAAPAGSPLSAARNRGDTKVAQQLTQDSLDIAGWLRYTLFRCCTLRVGTTHFSPVGCETSPAWSAPLDHLLRVTISGS